MSNEIANFTELMMFLDYETNGEDPLKAIPLEMAFKVVLADTLEPIGVEYQSVIRPRGPLEMPPILLEMHSRSGLLQEINNGKDYDDIDGEVARLLETNIFPKVGPYRMSIAGFSCAYDQNICHRFMPEVFKKLHYRIFDVSSLRTAWHQWVHTIVRHKGNAHRAMQDVNAALTLARAYRKTLRELVHLANNKVDFPLKDYTEQNMVRLLDREEILWCTCPPSSLPYAASVGHLESCPQWVLPL